MKWIKNTPIKEKTIHLYKVKTVSWILVKLSGPSQEYKFKHTIYRQNKLRTCHSKKHASSFTNWYASSKFVTHTWQDKWILNGKQLFEKELALQICAEESMEWNENKENTTIWFYDYMVSFADVVMGPTHQLLMNTLFEIVYQLSHIKIWLKIRSHNLYTFTDKHKSMLHWYAAM